LINYSVAVICLALSLKYFRQAIERTQSWRN
jgi:hypothetical protein